MTHYTSLIEPKKVTATLSKLIEPEAVFEIRVLSGTTKENEEPGIYSGFFTSPEKASAALRCFASFKGVYFTLNPAGDELLRRSENKFTRGGKATSDRDIVKYRWLLVDVDPVRPTDLSATKQELEAAKGVANDVFSFLKKQGWPAPIGTNSGNGFHLLYRIDLSTDDKQLVANILKTLDGRFSNIAATVDVSVANPSRICRLPGTRNCKGEATEERPHRMARIVTPFPDELVTVPRDKLEEFVDQLTTELPNCESVESSCRLADHPGASEGERNTICCCLVGAELNRIDVFDDEAIETARQDTIDWAGRCNPPFDEDEATEIFDRLLDKQQAQEQERRDRSIEVFDQFADEEPKLEDVETPAETLEFRPFPIHALPPSLQHFVSEASTSMGCNPSFMACCVLAVCSGAIGGAVKVAWKRDWVVSAALWIALVGSSGCKKSAAMRAALKPLKKVEADGRVAAASAAAAISKDHNVFAAFEAEEIPRQGQKPHNSRKKGPSVICPEEKTDESEPSPPRYLVSDVTTEKLGEMLAQDDLLMFKDELDGLFQGFNQYKGGGNDAQRYLEFYSGSSVMIDRKGGDALYVDQPFLSILGGVQHGIIANIFSGKMTTNGMFARWLFCNPPFPHVEFTEECVSPRVEQVYGEIIEKLAHLRDYSPVVVELDDDAKELRAQIYNDHQVEMRELPDALKASWSKLEEAVARIAIQLHVVKCVCEDIPLEGARMSRQTVEAAFEIMCFFKHEAKRVHRNASLQSSPVQLAMEAVNANGGRITVRGLMRKNRKTFKTTAQAESTLSKLVQKGMLHRQIEQTSGRPKTWFISV